MLECYEKGFELAKKVGSIWWISWIGANLVESYVAMGNMDKAISLAEESVALDRKAGNLAHLSISMFELGFVRQVTGEWDQSERYYKEALRISQGLNQFQQIAFSYWYLGWLHFDKGEYVKARELIEKAVEVFEKAEARYYQMVGFAFLSWTYIELGEIEKAKILIDDLQKFALEVEDKLLIAAADARRAQLFRTQRKWKESMEYFEKSLQGFEALNARRWNVYIFAKVVLCEYAQVYLERDRKGDREKALNLLNQALEIFQKIGAKKDIEKVIAKKKLLTA